LLNTVPEPAPQDVVGWAEHNIRLPGSAKSERFDCSITPWLREPLERLGDDETRTITFVKPVQSGGSTLGEIALCFWASFFKGIVQNNWPNDPRAKSRWRERILPALEACAGVRWSGERYDRASCEGRLVSGTVKVQGVFLPEALDSDSVPYQVNEEIHAWKAGHLAKARNRQTAVWFAKAVDVSNAGNKGDQLENAFLSGSAQKWEVRCPGCGQFHVMRTRWEDNKQTLGGLRYDVTGCVRSDGTFDYAKLNSTIRFQMPCGFPIYDDPVPRRALSLAGKYSEGTASGIGHRSYTLEAVAVDYIPWVKLIEEKHLALRALRHGDIEPWRRYITERECGFFSDESRPFHARVTINPALKKNRDGLDKRAIRFWAADKQKGWRERGELSHYWLLIRDVMESCDSQLVYEGRIDTDSELIAVLDDHKCQRFAGGVDASWDTKSVLEICYRNGLNAFLATSSHKGFFTHRDRVKRFYSEGRALHLELNMPPRFNYAETDDGWMASREEPMVIDYNVAGMIANLFFLREHEGVVKSENPSGDFITWSVPGDVSDEYKLHSEAWERSTVKEAQSNEERQAFTKIRKDDHLLMCEGYVAMLMDIGGFVGARLAKLGIGREELSK